MLVDARSLLIRQPSMLLPHGPENPISSGTNRMGWKQVNERVVLNRNDPLSNKIHFCWYGDRFNREVDLVSGSGWEEFSGGTANHVVQSSLDNMDCMFFDGDNGMRFFKGGHSRLARVDRTNEGFSCAALFHENGSARTGTLIAQRFNTVAAWQLYLQGGSVVFRSGSIEITLINNADVPNDRWTLTAVTWGAGDTGNILGYINGEHTDTNDYANTPGGTDIEVSVGCRHTSSTTPGYELNDGYIAAAWAWNRVLNPEEIRRHARHIYCMTRPP